MANDTNRLATHRRPSLRDHVLQARNSWLESRPRRTMGTNYNKSKHHDSTKGGCSKALSPASYDSLFEWYLGIRHGPPGLLR